MYSFWDVVRLMVLSSALIGVDGVPLPSDKGELVERGYTASNSGTCTGGLWNVADAGVSFNTHFSIDFTTATTGFTQTPLIVAVNAIGKGANPYGRTFTQANTQIVTGVGLEMTVPGGQIDTTFLDDNGDPSITSSQVQTQYNDVLYCSVRTVAKLSPVAGTVHGTCTLHLILQ